MSLGSRPRHNSSVAFFDCPSWVFRKTEGSAFPGLGLNVSVSLPHSSVGSLAPGDCTRRQAVSYLGDEAVASWVGLLSAEMTPREGRTGYLSAVLGPTRQCHWTAESRLLPNTEAAVSCIIDFPASRAARNKLPLLRRSQVMAVPQHQNELGWQVSATLSLRGFCLCSSCLSNPSIVSSQRSNLSIQQDHCVLHSPLPHALGLKTLPASSLFWRRPLIQGDSEMLVAVTHSSSFHWGTKMCVAQDPKVSYFLRFPKSLAVYGVRESSNTAEG